MWKNCNFKMLAMYSRIGIGKVFMISALHGSGTKPQNLIKEGGNEIVTSTLFGFFRNAGSCRFSFLFLNNTGARLSGTHVPESLGFFHS